MLKLCPTRPIGSNTRSVSIVNDRSRQPFDLPVIQQWMQAVITHADGVAPGISDDEARSWIDVGPEEVESVVTPSRKRTSVQRLEVYANAYFARLIECLKSIFPIFAQTVGDELFDQFAISYLRKYPSRSYTLNRLGDQFVEFLGETRPEDQSAEPGWVDFLICLARLEQGIDLVFDGPGYEGKSVIGPEELAEWSPEAFWLASAKLVPCLQLLEFSFPVSDFLTAAKRDPAAAIPAAKPTWLALSRRDFVVRRIPLTEFQYSLLNRLAAGEPIGQSVEAALEQTGEPDDLAQLLAVTFRKFASEQLFFSITAS